MDVLDKASLKLVATLDIQGKRMTGGIAVGTNAYISVAAGIDLFIFDLKSFKQVKIVPMSKSPTFFEKFNQNMFVMCQISNLEFFNTLTNEVSIRYSHDASRFLYASMTSRQNEVVLGCEKGIYFIVVDEQAKKVTRNEVEYYLQGKVV